jgi:hypothetical protein
MTGIVLASIFALNTKGSAIAKAVGRRLPTVAARIRSVFRSCGNFGGRNNKKGKVVPVLN